MTKIAAGLQACLKVSETRAEKDAVHAVESGRTASPTRVLLADGNLAVLETVTRMLESQFEVVGKISDGSSLLTAAEKLKPDVMIVDVQVPGLSGFEALRRLRKRRVRCPVIFLTVHQDQALAEEARLIGAMGYVLKPTADIELLPAIRDALQGSFFLSSALRAH